LRGAQTMPVAMTFAALRSKECRQRAPARAGCATVEASKSRQAGRRKLMIRTAHRPGHASPEPGKRTASDVEDPRRNGRRRVKMSAAMMFNRARCQSAEECASSACRVRCCAECAARTATQARYVSDNAAMSGGRLLDEPYRAEATIRSACCFRDVHAKRRANAQ